MQDFVAHGEAQRFGFVGAALRPASAGRFGSARHRPRAPASQRPASAGDGSAAAAASLLAAAASSLHDVFDAPCGFMRSSRARTTSNVTTCSDLNQPRGPLALDDAEVRRFLDELSRPASSALLGELADAPRRHHQQQPPGRRPLMTIFFTSASLRNSCCATAAHRARRSRSVVPMSYQRPVCISPLRARCGDRPAQQRQQRKLSGLHSPRKTPADRCPRRSTSVAIPRLLTRSPCSSRKSPRACCGGFGTSTRCASESCGRIAAQGAEVDVRPHIAIHQQERCRS